MKSEAIRILLIEDNPDEVILLCEELGKADNRFEIECVGRLSKGLERLERENFDVILLDISLPDS